MGVIGLRKPRADDKCECKLHSPLSKKHSSSHSLTILPVSQPAHSVPWFVMFLHGYSVVVQIQLHTDRMSRSIRETDEEKDHVSSYQLLFQYAHD